MKPRKYRWSKVYESTEEELTDFLASRHIQASPWVGEAFETSESYSFDAEATIWCAEGSCSFKSAAKTVSLQPGDALHVPATLPFELIGGISGYICYKS